MRNICVFIQWITFGKVCLGACRKEVCCKKNKD
jgi:hypothetical protein